MVAENERTWKQRYLYRMFSHHTKDKEMENYVVNAIWARLDDLNVKPVTQQYVRRPNGYALIDLYFPQINYGVECDEAYHKDNTLKDAAREIDLQTALSACSEDGLTIRRVDATLDADALHARIREIVKDRTTAVIVISDDVLEVIQNCNRIIVVKKGRITDELSNEGLDEATLVSVVTSRS